MRQYQTKPYYSSTHTRSISVLSKPTINHLSFIILFVSAFSFCSLLLSVLLNSLLSVCLSVSLSTAAAVVVSPVVCLSIISLISPFARGRERGCDIRRPYARTPSYIYYRSLPVYEVHMIYTYCICTRVYIQQYSQYRSINHTIKRRYALATDLLCGVYYTLYTAASTSMYHM